MKIIFTRYEEPTGRKYWVADFEGTPGSPPIGTGYTKAEAVATLFIRNLKNLPDMTTLTVDGKLFKEPGGRRR